MWCNPGDHLHWWQIQEGGLCGIWYYWHLYFDFPLLNRIKQFNKTNTRIVLNSVSKGWFNPVVLMQWFLNGFWYWLIMAEISGCWSLKVRTGQKPRYDGNKGWIRITEQGTVPSCMVLLNASQFYPVKEPFRWDGWRIMNQNNVLKCTCQVHFKSFKKILWNFSTSIQLELRDEQLIFVFWYFPKFWAGRQDVISCGETSYSSSYQEVFSLPLFSYI